MLEEMFNVFSLFFLYINNSTITGGPLSYKILP